MEDNVEDMWWEMVLSSASISTAEIERVCPRCWVGNPNRETIRAIAEAQAGIGLTRYDSIEDMFGDLNQSNGDEEHL